MISKRFKNPDLNDLPVCFDLTYREIIQIQFRQYSIENEAKHIFLVNIGSCILNYKVLFIEKK